jgi:hypothetical protein
MSKKETLRKIDRLVVERIYGLKVTTEEFARCGRHDKVYVKQEDCPDTDTFYTVNDVPLTDCGYMTDRADVAYFSSNIKTAFDLVAKLRTMDNCCIKLNLDVPGNIWRVEIKGHHYDCKQKGVVDGRASLPLQIALAGLLSVGVTREELKELGALEDLD